MADRKSKGKSRAPDAVRGQAPRVPDASRVLADATDRVSDQSGRLSGEDPSRPTREAAAHWIAVYSELLSFKAELLAITAKRQLSMSEDACGEAVADQVVITAQADKYSRRLAEWKGLADGPSPQDAPVLSLFVEGRARLFGHLLIDPWKRTVVNGGQPQHLTQTEWQLLRTFLEHPGEPLTREELATSVWPDGFDPPFGKVDVSVSRLRRKLETATGEAPLIETMRGTGYRLVLPLEDVELPRWWASPARMARRPSPRAARPAGDRAGPRTAKAEGWSEPPG